MTISIGTVLLNCLTVDSRSLKISVLKLSLSAVDIRWLESV